MSISSLAIDFGTSRTKVGWRDASGEIHCLQWGDQPYLPSVFHLPPDSADILLGEEALEAMEDDPIGGIENFKRQILESGGMELTYPDRQESPEVLVAHFFQGLRRACLAQIPGSASY